MGIDGQIKIEITTEFDYLTNSVSRTIKFLGGAGLNSLVPESMGDPESWDLNGAIMRDTLDFADGEYDLIVSQKTDGYGNYFYRWEEA